MTIEHYVKSLYFKSNALSKQYFEAHLFPLYIGNAFRHSSMLNVRLCHYNVIMISFSDTEAVPTRKANLTLEIGMNYDNAFNNLSSPQSKEFVKTLVEQVQELT